MTLAAGTRLGPYKVLSLIGAGGMGEVYKAHDTRLGRDVALKVLPSGAAFDAERQQRFEREARATSALNHPNIVSVYDIGAEGDTSFIVTELVNGESLRDVLEHGPVPARKLLDLAVQVTDGLSAAHTAGVVHRDLKPENIMLTRDGRAKILDFGIATSFLRVPSQGETTLAMRLTEPGKVMGTVTYMSPEQARGAADLDGRSDQFSLGVVLYELATGRNPFDRPTAAEVMTAIIREDPAPLPTTVASPLRWVIERCLAKELSQRYDTTHDLFLELRSLRDHATEIGTGSQFSTAKEGMGAQRRWRSTWLSVVLIALALATGVYVGLRFLQSPPASFERLTYRRGDISGARYSPDSETVVFSAQWANEPMTIFSLRPGSREYRPLDLPEGRILSISSTGEMLLLLGPSVPGTLASVPLSGGAPREILANVNDADWSPDGSSMAVSRTVGRKSQIEFPVGTVRYATDGAAPLFLRVSPRGDRIAFFEPEAVGDYAVTVLDSNSHTRVLSRGWQAAAGLTWSTKGDEIWFGASKAGGKPALRAVTLSGKERIVVQVPAYLMIDNMAKDGKLLAAVVDSRIGLSALAPGAGQERDLSWFDASRIFDISTDGRTILFIENSYGKARNPAIYLRKTDGSPAVHLADGNRPALSPDDRWVACIQVDGAKTQLMLLPTGAGEARPIGTPSIHYERVEWFPDGQRILFTGNEPNRPLRTFAQNVQGGNPEPITPEGMTAAHVSPDGRFVTVATDGKLRLWPLAGGEARKVANLEPGESVIGWSKDGNSILVWRRDGASGLKISRLVVSTGRRELWKELEQPDSVGVQIGPVVVTPDEKAYAYSFQRDSVSLYSVKGLR